MMDAPTTAGRGRVLVITKDTSLHQLIGQQITADGFTPDSRATVKEALSVIQNTASDLAAIVCDQKALDGAQGSLLIAANLAHPPVPVVLIVEEEGLPSHVAGLECGAFDCLCRQAIPTPLVGVKVRRAALRRQELAEKAQMTLRLEARVREVAELRREHAQLVKLATHTLAKPAVWVEETLDQLVKANQRFIAVGDVAMTMTSIRNVDEILGTIMDKATVVVDGEASALLLLDETHGDLTFRVAMGEKGDALGTLRIKIGEGIAGWVAQERRSLLIPDAYADPRFNKEFDHKTGFVTRSILCAPLLFRDRLLGVVQAINKRHGGVFTSEDLDIFNHFAQFGAIALENAKAYQKVAVERDVLEQRVRELEIKVDDVEKARQVQAITDSEYFVALRDRAAAIRKKL